jgi:hypothetical protein
VTLLKVAGALRAPTANRRLESWKYPQLCSRPVFSDDFDLMDLRA